MHVAITVDPDIPVPPKFYGGIERVVDLLARGLVERGHRVTLFAHRDSHTVGRLVAYPAERPAHALDVARNTLTISRLLLGRPDIIHSFGRLATLGPLLFTKTPKLMSYQREPTLDRVRLAMRLSPEGSMAFTGCSNYIADQIRPFGPSYTVYNGTPIRSIPFTDTVDGDAPLVFLGRIEQIKGTHNAIAVARKSGRRLVIAGNIADQDYFEREIRPHLSDRIDYIGPVDDRQKSELLSRSLAFLMPIEWNEPFGIVMVEALACGTPVIGMPRGAVPEVVIEGQTGFLRNSVDEMAAAVAKVATLSRKACRADCEARFSDDAIVEQYLNVYRQRIA